MIAFPQNSGIKGTTANIGTDGQCLVSILRQNGLISQNATVCSPAASKPMEKPPMPEKISRTFNILVFLCLPYLK